MLVYAALNPVLDLGTFFILPKASNYLLTTWYFNTGKKPNKKNRRSLSV